MTGAVVHHAWCQGHDPGPEHPEGADRLEGILGAVRADTALRGAVREVQARPATLQDLLRVHAPEHLALVRKAAEEASSAGGVRWLDPDTAVSALSFEAALASAGCAIEAAELVARGEASAAFACCRPPGHHATPDRAMGFCLFNNVAVAARRLQARFAMERLLIVDWDVHHGNGTQEIFWEDPSIYYLSLHLYPHYPGTGAASERGAGAGAGTTRNVPLGHGTTAAEYRDAFREALDATLEEFTPEMVLVSAGFDCLAGDPLGGILLEPADLHAIASDLLERTRSATDGRIAAVLEGGYVPARMGQAVADVLRSFCGLPASAGEATSPSPAAP
ncbi:MAG TPA: histone deacetylase [Anaeromyxobacteraceae bacterium]|nr:histone deacetylase [Anaeromyxobacteraceae bacterium]